MEETVEVESTFDKRVHDSHEFVIVLWARRTIGVVTNFLYPCGCESRMTGQDLADRNRRPEFRLAARQPRELPQPFARWPRHERVRRLHPLPYLVRRTVCELSTPRRTRRLVQSIASERAHRVRDAQALFKPTATRPSSSGIVLFRGVKTAFRDSPASTGLHAVHTSSPVPTRIAPKVS